MVQVDPKKLHKTMPWSGGQKWTIIGHTVGQYRTRLGFAVQFFNELRALEVQGGFNEEQEITWRLLDEEELLAPTVPQQFKDVVEGVDTANQAAAANLDVREFLVCRDRYDVEEWLTLCRMTEGPDEVHGLKPCWRP